MGRGFRKFSHISRAVLAYVDPRVTTVSLPEARSLGTLFVCQHCPDRWDWDGKRVAENIMQSRWKFIQYGLSTLHNMRACWRGSIRRRARTSARLSAAKWRTFGIHQILFSILQHSDAFVWKVDLMLDLESTRIGSMRIRAIRVDLLTVTVDRLTVYLPIFKILWTLPHYSHDDLPAFLIGKYNLPAKHFNFIKLSVLLRRRRPCLGNSCTIPRLPTSSDRLRLPFRFTHATRTCPRLKLARIASMKYQLISPSRLSSPETLELYRPTPAMSKVSKYL